MGKVYLFNTLVVPINFDQYSNATVVLSRITVQEARAILSHGFVSAIGHEGTAQVLSQLLGISIKANRVTVFMQPGDIGVHFFLKQRLPEGKVLSAEELKQLDFWLVKSEVK